MIRITTRLAHSRAGVARKPLREQNPLKLPGNARQFILLPANARRQYKVLLNNMENFRLEAENAMNHPVFSDPANGFGSTNFGQITGTKVGNRNVQLGFKYYF